MLAALYDMWGVLAGVSIAISIITAIVSVYQWFVRNCELPRAVKIAMHFLFFCSGAVVASSCALGIFLTKAPIVYNKTVREAAEIFKNAGLELALPEGMLYDEHTQNRTVIGQSYEGDAPIPKGTKITVYIDSTGLRNPQKTVIVPKVVGSRYMDAMELLSESGLRHRVFIVDENDVSLKNAYVVSQSILDGASAPEGSLLELGVSAEKDFGVSDPPSMDLIEVPYVIDMKDTEATKMLEDLGLKVMLSRSLGVKESPEGCSYVLAQSIPDGVSVPAGTRIELEQTGVKRGTSVTVPDVMGMEQTEATRLLKNTGLNYQVWWIEEYIAPQDECQFGVYYIINQSVPAGSTVSAGTLVKLQLSMIKP